MKNTTCQNVTFNKIELTLIKQESKLLKGISARFKGRSVVFPTITRSLGSIFCHTKNITVEYALRHFNKPIGVTPYFSFS